MTEIKVCSICKLPKPMTDFGKDTGKKDNKRAECRDCHNAKNQEDRSRNPEKNRERARKWRQNNLEHEREYHKQYNASHREYQNERWKRYMSEPGRYADAQKRKRTNSPEKMRARDAVSRAVRSGKLPRVKTLRCFRCGDQAAEYHHHKGYAKEHEVDVVPVCRSCHKDLG